MLRVWPIIPAQAIISQTLGQNSQQRNTVKARLNAHCDTAKNISYYEFLNTDTSWNIRQDIYLVGGHGKNSYYLHWKRENKLKDERHASRVDFF